MFMYGIERILAALTKKTSEAVRAPTYALQEKEKKKRKGLCCSQVNTLLLFLKQYLF